MGAAREISRYRLDLFVLQKVRWREALNEQRIVLFYVENKMKIINSGRDSLYIRK